LAPVVAAGFVAVVAAGFAAVAAAGSARDDVVSTDF